ncbi:MAG: hypothetical protein NUW01_09990 [Gemmatimonadaceae bacterium]|nr:hypothetical protein [Gemmatimonadaceae bacterium]
MTWRRSAVDCAACGYRWEAVTEGEGVPVALECPTCRQMAGEVPAQEDRDQWAGYRFSGNQR